VTAGIGFPPLPAPSRSALARPGPSPGPPVPARGVSGFWIRQIPISGQFRFAERCFHTRFKKRTMELFRQVKMLEDSDFAAYDFAQVVSPRVRDFDLAQAPVRVIRAASSSFCSATRVRTRSNPRPWAKMITYALMVKRGVAGQNAAQIPIANRWRMFSSIPHAVRGRYRFQKFQHT
jgi:hypothetical protein